MTQGCVKTMGALFDVWPVAVTFGVLSVAWGLDRNIRNLRALINELETKILNLVEQRPREGRALKLTPGDSPVTDRSPVARKADDAALVRALESHVGGAEFGLTPLLLDESQNDVAVGLAGVADGVELAAPDLLDPDQALRVGLRLVGHAADRERGYDRLVGVDGDGDADHAVGLDRVSGGKGSGEGDLAVLDATADRESAFENFRLAILLLLEVFEAVCLACADQPTPIGHGLAATVRASALTGARGAR
jgi:hypothetical protein